jgi:hypothetical protein
MSLESAAGAFIKLGLSGHLHEPGLRLHLRNGPGSGRWLPQECRTNSMHAALILAGLI